MLNRMAWMVAAAVGAGLVWWGTVLAAQQLAEGDSVRIDTIRVVGNVRSKPEIILRELDFSPGDWITAESLRRAENHLRNLQLFNHVNFRLHRKANRHADLEVQVW